MKLYSENNEYKLYEGNMLDMLEVIPENSIDSIVTDPPYELGFMGKSWDSSGIAFQKETWEKCLKVLKPGGHMLAFGGTRTYHRIACAIEDAGFEIRDCIMWVYGSGFPKSMNIGLAIDKKNGIESKIVGTKKQSGAKFKLTQELIDNGGFNDPNRVSFDIKQAQNEFAGWGTSLKPSYEPIIVARKPVESSIVENVMKWGVGGINIDECRVGNEEISTHKAPKGTFAGGDWDRGSDTSSYDTHNGRFPANLIHDGSEEVISLFPDCKGASSQNNYSNGHIYRGQSLQESNTSLEGYRDWYNDDGSAARFFYCAKASKRDRDEGLEEFEEKKVYGEDMQWGYGNANGDTFGDRIANVTRKNVHPTVKPTELMQYLVRLVSPKGSTILDPFNGSGSTGKAVMFENRERDKNYKYIGIELTPDYLPISKARIEYAQTCSLDKEETTKIKSNKNKKVSLID